jgi:tetratricopeptide (TPR) repeat protein
MTDIRAARGRRRHAFTRGRRRHPLVLGLFALLLIAGCGGGADEPQVWVIGLDGADWDILDPMIERGELPNLAKLREEGAYGRLRSDEPLLSPMIWTSIATGRTVDEHGITWFMTDGPDGEKIPISSRNRNVRALWNIATERDRSSTVIGWWATWPVEPIDGYMVSDYVGWHSFGVTGQQIDAPGKVWPSDMQTEILDMLPSPDDVDDALLQTMVDLPPEKLGFDPERGPLGGPLPHLRQAVATARGYTDIALDLLDRRRTDFFAVYYEGTDATMHLFGNYSPPQQPWVTDEDYAAFRNAVRGYWQYQDRLLGELLEERGPNTTVMIISDHGFRTGEERLREERFEIERADASHMIDGAIVLNGPGVEPGTRLRAADIYDIAPTVLHLMGLPVARDMAGDVLEDAYTEEFLASNPVERIETYETGTWDRGDDIVIDPEAGESMEEMLRSLGYISGGADDEDGGDDTVASGGGMSVEHAVNLANVLRGQGRLQEAAATLEEQLERNPRHVESRLNLAQVYGEMGDFERSLELFAELHRERPEDLDVIEDYALGLARAGRIEDVVQLYRKGLEIDPDWAVGLAGQGLAEHRLGRSEEGLRKIRRAVEIDPRFARAHFYLATVLRDRGDLAGARDQLERTLELDPTHEQAALQLAQFLQSRGQAERARTFLEDFLEKSGASSPVSAEIAAIDLRAGRPEQALPILEEAVSDFPRDTDLLGNLGMAYAMTENLPRARATFERLLEVDPNSAEAHAQLGQFLLQSGDTEAARRHLERAAELAPDDSGVQIALATFHHRRGQLDEAMQIYEDVLEREPENALALYQLALATGASGDEDTALELLERARELDPTLPMPQRKSQ